MPYNCTDRLHNIVRQDPSLVRTPLAFAASQCLATDSAGLTVAAVHSLAYQLCDAGTTCIDVSPHELQVVW